MSSYKLNPMTLAACLGVAASAHAGVTQPDMRQRVDAEIASLIAGSQAAVAVNASALSALPAPVRRYLAYTGADKAAPARFARLRFEGEVRLPVKGTAQGVEQSTPWMSTTGEQYMTLSDAGLGYVWDSSWRRGPFFTIDVRDIYSNGSTHIWAVRQNGQVMVDEAHAEINQTYMIRFFAEATQSPTMLMPSRFLHWEAVDENRARAVATDGPLQASMVCRFTPVGELTACESDDRKLRYSGDVTERWVAAKWVMTRSDYKTFGALRVPTRMTVTWKFPEGDFEQVRAQTLSVDFDVRQKY